MIERTCVFQVRVLTYALAGNYVFSREGYLIFKHILSTICVMTSVLRSVLNLSSPR